MLRGLAILGAIVAGLGVDVIDEGDPDDPHLKQVRYGAALLDSFQRAQRYRVKSKARVRHALAQIRRPVRDRQWWELELYRAQDSARTWKHRVRAYQTAWDKFRMEHPEVYAEYQAIRRERGERRGK